MIMIQKRGEGTRDLRDNTARRASALHIVDPDLITSIPNDPLSPQGSLLNAKPGVTPEHAGCGFKNKQTNKQKTGPKPTCYLSRKGKQLVN